VPNLSEHNVNVRNLFLVTTMHNLFKSANICYSYHRYTRIKLTKSYNSTEDLFLYCCINFGNPPAL